VIEVEFYDVVSCGRWRRGRGPPQVLAAWSGV